MPDEPKNRVYDCRFCLNYNFDRDIDVESFRCEMMHFDFKQGGGMDEGKPVRMPGLTIDREELPCKGQHYSFGPTTRRWIELAKEYLAS